MCLFAISGSNLHAGIDAAQQSRRPKRMDLHEVQTHLTEWLQEASAAFQKVPGSAVLIRYVRSSYQNDPVRSAIELVLVIFFIRYLLSPSYSTSKQNYVQLTEDVSHQCPRRFRACQATWNKRMLMMPTGETRKSTSLSRNGRRSRWWRPLHPNRRPNWKSSRSSSGKQSQHIPKEK